MRSLHSTQCGYSNYCCRLYFHSTRPVEVVVSICLSPANIIKTSVHSHARREKKSIKKTKKVIMEFSATKIQKNPTDFPTDRI